jgi:hypothetical protein
MTNEQLEIATHLIRCTVLPGSWDKRFINKVGQIAVSLPKQDITESQNEWLFRLLYKYRRQMPNLYQKHKTNQFCKRLV